MATTHVNTLLIKGKKLDRAQTLTKEMSGKTFFLDSATEFAVTLPSPVTKGLNFEFIVTAAPSGASYTIVTKGAASIILGHVISSDLNAGADSDFETSGASTITFVNSVSVVGDKVNLISDGTYWYATGLCSVYNAITLT